MSPTRFTECELIKLGINVEVNGYNFYKSVAETVSDGNVSDFFLGLAEAERSHEKIFSDMLLKIGQKNEKQYSGDASLYLESLSKEIIFTRTNSWKNEIKKITCAKDALKLSIGFEFDSIRLYEDMKKFVSAEEMKTLVWLLEQEESHRLALQNRLNNISS